jgi:hypothetical protein
VTGLHEGNSWLSFLVDAFFYEKDVPIRKKCKKIAGKRDLEGKKIEYCLIFEQCFSKMEQKNPERAARDFRKSTFN